MMPDNFERLAWERIDGTISAEDDERLAAVMADDPKARQRFAEIEEMSDVLARVGEAEPPVELRPRIDRALAAASPRWRRRAPGFQMWRPRLAYLAAGLLLGAVVGQLLLPAPVVDSDRVSGAIVVADEIPEAAMSIDLDGGVGVLALWWDDPTLTSDLRLTTDRSFELTLEADETDLEIRRGTQMGSPSSAVWREAGRVVVRATGPGRQTVAVGFRGSASRVRIRVVGDDGVLADRVISLGDIGGSR